ncbi:MAG: class I SAM-dependent methyltransferase [Bacteroidota bacterium]
MRETNIGRLKNTTINKDNLNYLHYSSFHKHLFKAISTFANGKLLDIGCGNKPYKSLLDTHITEYIGCDIVQSSENCVDVLCPANNIPIADEIFDTVISTQTIEHVEDHQGLINEAYRLLAPGGKLILSGPMYWPLHEEPYDFFRFTKHGFRYILEKAGFELISIESNGGKWSVVGQAFLHALYPQVFNIKGVKGKVIRGFIKLIGGVKTINGFFEKLDNKAIDYTNTMNYVIVSKKPIQ